MDSQVFRSAAESMELLGTNWCYLWQTVLRSEDQGWRSFILEYATGILVERSVQVQEWGTFGCRV